MMSRTELRNVIDKSSFAMDDLRLFLDTHPYDNEARECFNKMEQIRSQAMHQYNASFGPMCAYDADMSNVREWNKGPWPWQAGGCK